MPDKVLAFFMGIGLAAGIGLGIEHWPKHKVEVCVPYTHFLSEQVSNDGAYVVHKEQKTWICTL